MGKSSLINAGLVEPLRQRKYLPIVVRLNDLTQGLAQSLLDSVRHAARHSRIDIVGGDATSAWRFFKTAEFWSEHNDLLRPVLILDQFEEIFTCTAKSYGASSSASLASWCADAPELPATEKHRRR